MAYDKKAPNLQNIPVFAKDDPRAQFGRDIRAAFRGEGKVLAGTDFSQIERQVVENLGPAHPECCPWHSHLLRCFPARVRRKIRYGL